MDNTTSSTPTAGVSPKKKSFWFTALLVIGIAVVAGFAVGIARKRAPAVPPYQPQATATPLPTTPPSSAPEADAQTEALGEVGTSSELGDIEQDLQATDLTGLDKEVGDIGKELGL